MINKKQKTYKVCGREFTIQQFIIFGVIFLLMLMFLITGIRKVSHNTQSAIDVDASMPDIDVQLLDINDYSRPGIATDPITGIVIHYTANPGSTAQQNRDFFNSLKDGHGGTVSSNFVVGLDGEIIQCVPTWEMAYASNDRNHDTISIECCHPDETGKFTDATYRSLVQLTAFLCLKYQLGTDEVIRHYDVTGKDCPKYYVENIGAWKQFKKDVAMAMERGNREEK